jgi:hypothetical protein
MKKKLRSILSRADGVVISHKQILRNLLTTPSAQKRRLRNILLRSRTPLLEEEGKRSPQLLSYVTIIAASFRPIGMVLAGTQVRIRFT